MHEEVDIPVDKLQAFYKVNPIQKVEKVTSEGAKRQSSSQENKNGADFRKCLLEYYESKTMEFQNPALQKTNAYNSKAMETLYDTASTVNFFG